MSEKEFLEKTLGIKYELIPCEKGLFVLKAKKDFADVKKGDLGGLVSKEVIISQNDDSWVYPEACVSGNVTICENTTIGECTMIVAKKKSHINIANSIIDHSLIVSSRDMKIEFCTLKYADITRQSDFMSLDYDENVTAYIGTDNKHSLLLCKDGYDKPVNLFAGLCMLDYSNNYDTIMQKAVEFKKKHTGFIERAVGMFMKEGA